MHCNKSRRFLKEMSQSEDNSLFCCMMPGSSLILFNATNDDARDLFIYFKTIYYNDNTSVYGEYHSLNREIVLKTL